MLHPLYPQGMYYSLLWPQEMSNPRRSFILLSSLLCLPTHFFCSPFFFSFSSHPLFHKYHVISLELNSECILALLRCLNAASEYFANGAFAVVLSSRFRSCPGNLVASALRGLHLGNRTSLQLGWRTFSRALVFAYAHYGALGQITPAPCSLRCCLFPLAPRWSLCMLSPDSFWF